MPTANISSGPANMRVLYIPQHPAMVVPTKKTISGRSWDEMCRFTLGPS
jgi:hypothetical protein